MNLVIAEYSTVRPHRHHQPHGNRHRHTQTGTSDRNGTTTEHTPSMNMVQAAFSTAAASSMMSTRSQKLFLVSSSQHHHQQPSEHKSARGPGDDSYQPNVSRWAVAMAGSHSEQPHSYQHHHQHHQRTTDFGFDVRARGSTRTFFADQPYTTAAPTLHSVSGATVITSVQWPPQSPRPDHRFNGKPHNIGYVQSCNHVFSC